MLKTVSQRLSHYLMIVMVIVPFIFTLFFVGYVYGFLDHASKWELIFGVSAVMLSFTLFSFLMIRKLGQRIKSLQQLVLGFSTNSNHLVELKEKDELAFIGNFILDLKKDLQRKAQFASHIKDGQLHSEYEPQHENDFIGHSLVAIKNNLIKIKEEEKKQNWSSEALGKFVEILRSSNVIKELSNNVIKSLVGIINANQGAIYIANKDDSGTEFLELQSCYAYNRTKYMAHQLAIGEGLIGQAYLEKETIYLKDVPDNFVKITSGLGEANPRNVLIVPLKLNDEIVGLIEVASFKEFSNHEITFVEKICENIAHTISSIRISEHTRKLLTESQELTEQMRAQEEELKQNQEQLQATQEEITRKYKRLFNELKTLNYESRFDQLKSITMARKRSIEYYFDIIRNQIFTFAENKMVIAAMKEFKHAFFELSRGITQNDNSYVAESLRHYYHDEFIPRLNENSDELESADKYLPSETITSLPSTTTFPITHIPQDKNRYWRMQVTEAITARCMLCIIR